MNLRGSHLQLPCTGASLSERNPAPYSRPQLPDSRLLLTVFLFKTLPFLCIMINLY